MTQLLLFDAPAAPSFSVSPAPVAVVAAPVADRLPRHAAGEEKRAGLDEAPRSRQASPRTARTARTPVAAPPRPAAQTSSDRQTSPRGGMHRMGDLAKLVIARYELVAQRRAALLARGPLPSVRF
jgi:hypothetical protein